MKKPYKVWNPEDEEEHHATFIEAESDLLAAEEYCELDWSSHSGNERMNDHGECDDFPIKEKGPDGAITVFSGRHEVSISHVIGSS